MNREETVTLAKAQIVADVKQGNVPRSCASFRKLHDYVDANKYGREQQKAELDFWNAVHDELDQWLKHGGLLDSVSGVMFNDYDLEVPQFALDLGFIDQSWHNDAAAHMSKGRLHLWVAEADPEQREFPQAPRFTLQLSLEEEFLSDAPEDLLQTDSEEEIIKLVRHLEMQDAGV